MASDATTAKFIGWFETAMRLAIPPLLGIAAWAYMQIVALDRRVTIIENSGHSGDVTSLKASVESLKIQGAVMQQQMATVVRAVENIERKLERGPAS
jgi:hypothetical protein